MTTYPIRKKQFEKENDIEIVFSSTIPAYKVVTSTGVRANSNTLSHSDKIIGMTIGNVSGGFSQFVKTSGFIDNPLWTFNTGDTVFLNNDEISTTPPQIGFSVEIGKFITSTKLLIDIKTSVIRSN